MARLGLFPLRAVLFPGMVLPLHIFEERYIRLIHRCIRQSEPFGVVLAASTSGGGPGDLPFHTVGTMGHVTEVDRLADGRMNISLLGRQRFRVRRLVQSEPHFVADVELHPMESESAEEGHRVDADLVERVRQLVAAYADLLVAAAASRVSILHLPSNAATLALLAAIVMQIPLEEKQSLLELPSYGALLRREEYLLLRENALMSFIAKAEEGEGESWPPVPRPGLN